jgi:segregation and condensation protein A
MREPSDHEGPLALAGEDSAARTEHGMQAVVDDGLPSIRAGNDDFSVEARGNFSAADAEGYLPTPESEMLRVRLQSFEGPLDLLLFLVQGHALDVLTVPLKGIVEQYLRVLDNMRELNLDVAGEFLVMAAQLAHLKSRMLLPREERPRESPFEPDPRTGLVRRLLEYQRFKDAALALDALPHLGRDVFARPLLPAQYDGVVDEPVEQGPELTEVDPIELIRLYNGVVQRQQKFVVHEVLVERISVGARINELVDVFSSTQRTRREAGLQTGGVHSFAELVDRVGPRTRRSVIVTFLSLLEMARLKLVRLRQDPESGAIDVEPVLDNLASTEQDGALKEQIASVDEFGGDGDDSVDDSVDDRVDDREQRASMTAGDAQRGARSGSFRGEAKS